jgi:AraC family transcriptional regulator
MKTQTLAKRRPHIARVVSHLQTPSDASLSHAALARMGGLSARQLDRVFERLVGETPRAFARRLRLEQAARDVATSTRSILAIALDTGFESHESFTRAFARHFGRSPSACRELAQVSLLPANRRDFWNLVLAGNLRRHIEGNLQVVRRENKEGNR